MKRPTLLGLLSALIVVTAAPAASAELFMSADRAPAEYPGLTSLLGGRTFGVRREYAARVELGWPALEVGYIVPFTRRLDISPELRIAYGRNLRAGLVGFEPGMTLKLNVVDTGTFALAFLTESALVFHIPTDGTSGYAGARLGPGFVGSWSYGGGVGGFAAVRFPLMVTFQANPKIYLPLLLDVGVESEVYRHEDAVVNVTATVTAGPEWCVNGCDRLDVTIEMLAGASVIF